MTSFAGNTCFFSKSNSTGFLSP